MDSVDNAIVDLPHETRHLFKRLCQTEDYRHDLRDIEEFLGQQLILHPYPTLQIVKYHTALSYNVLGGIVYNGFIKFVTDEQIDQNDEFFDKFLNFLANVQIEDDRIHGICEALLRKMSDFSAERRYKCHLSLLARPNHKLLKLFAETDSQQISLTSKATILCQTLHKKEHFILRLVDAEEIQSELLNSVCGPIIAIAKLTKLLSALNQFCIHDFSFPDELLALLDLSSESSPFVHAIYCDLKRMANIFDMLSQYITYELPLGVIISTRSLLELIYKQTKFSIMGIENACGYLIRNHMLYNKMLGVGNSNIELQILVAYQTLSAICDIYFKTKKDVFYTKVVDERLAVVMNSIRSIEDGNILARLLQNIFALIFLRWEDVAESLGSADPLDEVMFDVIRDPGRCGFVCNKFLLEKLLNIVLSVINERICNSALDESAKQSLQEIKHTVDDANWRIHFLQKNKFEQSTKVSVQLDIELVPSLFVFHEELLEQRNSDDDQADESSTSSTLTRKKSKLRKRLNSMPKTVPVSYRLAPSMLKDVKNANVAEDKGIVARMLGHPLDLAMIALSQEDIGAAKGIMKKFNLEDISLERDISFLENMRYIKSQLQKAIARYEEQEAYLKSQSTIEQIKKVAAIGFETSRITNIIEEFSHANQVVPNVETAAFIEKYCTEFPFLRQYESNKLHICVILDLIVNLNMNHELSSNLWNMTNRLYASEALLDELNGQEELYRGVGPVHFFSNIVQCLHLFKTVCKENLGARDMLCNTFFTLRSGSMRSELEKENIFKFLFKKSCIEIDTVLSLKTMGKSLDELKAKTNYFNRFLRYITNMAKLLEIVDTKYSPQDNIYQMLDANMKHIVGEILFERGVLPTDIEHLVFSVNLNLVHTIALSVCPIIEHKARVAPALLKSYEFKDDAIGAYVFRQSRLLCFILQHISNSHESNLFLNSEYFKNALELPESAALASIYNENKAVATILFDKIDSDQLKTIQDRETIVAIYKTNKEKFRNSVRLSTLKDDTIIELIRNDVNRVELVEKISDLNMCVDILLENMVKIRDSELATSLIQSILLDDRLSDVDPEKKCQLERYLKDIRIFSEVAKDFLFHTWSGAYVFGEGSPELIMKKLVKLKKYELCCEWWELHKKSTSLPLKAFYDVFFSCLIQTKKQINPHLLRIIESFPVAEVVDFFEVHVEKFRNVVVLNYVVSYLDEHSRNGEGSEITETAVHLIKYQNFRVSLDIFNHMTHDECEQSWEIFSRPLLIIEQFVMNSKFEVLSNILDSVRPLLGTLESCKYCSGQADTIYEIPMNSSITLGNPKNSAFLLLNFNLYQSDHIITSACLDTILQIYATKALDYRINETQCNTDPASLSTEMASLDSLYGAFVMPTEAPTKDNWIKDEDSMQCMCCKRAVFTMLTRRHHCRRCGRVVCYSCSVNRLKIPDLYEDIPVRVCNDCLKQSLTLEAKSKEKTNTSSLNGMNTENIKKKKATKATDWQLSGNLTHDKLLREEFSYEHAPSTHLCLSILSFHSNNAEYVNLLLHHCRKFAKLLRPLRPGYPNPEIDYGLVAKMLNCLALAAKVRGGPPECDTIRDHSEIIISVVQNGCESLLPMEPISSQSLRKLGDSMVLAEKWPVALDIYLKCGHSTAGVMAAYGLACLRAGRYETARDQLLYCMSRLCKPYDVANILKFITTEHELDVHSEIDIPTVKRPNRSPPLLDEIIKVIQSTSKQTHVPETLARADSIRNSNTSLASSRSKPKDKIPILEPAINIMNTISNLKQISQGNYCDISIRKLDNKTNVFRRTLMFEECLYYLLSYGTHVDIVNFLVRQDQTMCALRYYILQNLDNNIFIKNIYVPHLKRGQVDYLIRQMATVDSQLSIWKDAIIQTCWYLEKKNLLNCLYHLQILLNDPIRASMTCVKFYSMNCSNFRELQNNSFHLINAQKHLQSELEMCQWENINLNKKRPVKEPSFLMQMDAKTLNCHINTILRQMEVTKFLAKAEQDERSRRLTRQILKQVGIESTTVPTLFDSIQEKIQICILVLLYGNNIEEGFGLAYRILQDYNLPSTKIYTTAGKCLARSNRLAEIRNLINCIKSNSETDQSEYDTILSLSIHAANNIHLPETKVMLDELIKLVSDVATKISCHIYVGQLKSAYLLAVQHNRLNDIMKILNQAEATNQNHIVRLCEKKLNINQR